MKPLIGYEWPEGRCKQISFISQDHHIHEFCVSNGGTWQHADLTMLASAPLAHRRFLIGFAWPEGGTKQVAYVGPDHHVHELVVGIGGMWQYTDLSALTSAARAVDLMVGYEWAESRCKQVAFVGEDSHIHELCLVAGNQWMHADLSTITNAPPATDILAGYAWPGHSKQVAYVGQDGHIHELYVVAAA